MKINVETERSIGEIAYSHRYIGQEVVKFFCEICKGKGELELKSCEVITCPACLGKGITVRNVCKREVYSGTISKIKVEVDTGKPVRDKHANPINYDEFNTKELYWIDLDKQFLRENRPNYEVVAGADIFDTYEEAEADARHIFETEIAEIEDRESLLKEVED